MFNNPDIITEGLMLTYFLPEKRHRQLHEEIYFRRFGAEKQPELTDEFELTIGNIIIKFVKESEI
jgi:hypothetical protein